MYLRLHPRLTTHLGKFSKATGKLNNYLQLSDSIAVIGTFTKSIQPSLAFKVLSVRLPSLILTIVLVSQ